MNFAGTEVPRNYDQLLWPLQDMFTVVEVIHLLERNFIRLQLWLNSVKVVGIIS